jgi:phosphoglycolate phosphatase
MQNCLREHRCFAKLKSLSKDRAGSWESVSSRLILFDFDYTLFDASACLFPALRKGLQAIGGSDPADSILKRLIGISLHQQFVALTGSQDVKLWEMFESAYVKERAMREADGTHPVPGAIPAIRALKKKGFLLGVVSTGARKRILRALARARALSYFGDDAIIGGADNKGEAICRALAHFHTRRQNAFYVGDRPDDHDASLDAGVSFIGVATGAFSAKDFPDGCIVLSSVAVMPEYLETAYGMSL